MKLREAPKIFCPLVFGANIRNLDESSRKYQIASEASENFKI